MKKDFIQKLLITVLIITICLFTMATYSVEAANANTSNKLTQLELEKDEVILQYDSKTGQTTEVNMDELRQSINKMYRNGTVGINAIQSYEGDVSNVNIITVNNEDENTLMNEGVQIMSEQDFNDVGDTSLFPNRAVCRLTMFDASGNTKSSSGYLAGPNLLLTAAHCVMDKENNDFIFTNWTAYPGYVANKDNPDVGHYYGGASGWSRIIYPSGWHSAENDWCICILERNLGTLANAWLGSQAYGTNSEMTGLPVKAIGYPIENSKSGYQKYTSGTLSNVSSNKFDTSSKIVRGMSGGPIVRSSDNVVVGICSAFYPLRPNTGIGTRITQDIINLLLENWAS